MAKGPSHILFEIERFLTDALRNNDCLNYEDLQPSLIVRQIDRELADKHFIWLGKETYVPSRIVVRPSSTDPQKRVELKLLLSSRRFINLLTQYIFERGFKLFQALKTDIATEEGESTAGKFDIEFSWPAAEEFRDVAAKERKRIVETFGFKPQPLADRSEIGAVAAN